MSKAIAFPPLMPKTYRMAEVARIIGKSYTHLRRVFSLELAPEPKHSRRKGAYRERLWTKEEVISLNRWFASIESGDLMIQKAIDKKAGKKR